MRKAPHRAAGPWRVAEWTSLLLSVLLVGALTVFLIVQALRPRSPFVDLQARLLLERTESRGNSFVTPLEVTNLGHRTLTRVVVALRPEGGAEGGEREIEVTYLGEGATRTTYVVFDRDPRGSGVLVAQPTHYELE